MTDNLAHQRVIVVVPTRNSGFTLRTCLESIRAQSYSCTLVVVDNNSSDNTVRIASELADLVLEAGPERSAQRNFGARSVSSEIVGFIDSDMILSTDVVKEVVAAIATGATSVVVPETTVGEGYWAQVSAFERSFYDGSESIEAPRFFPSRTFSDVGGFDEAMTGGEDWDLGLRTVSSGPRVRVNARIVHEEGRVSFVGICRKKAYYAPGVALFIRKHGMSGIAGMSRRPWLQEPRVLLQPLGLGLVVLKVAEAMSMVVGAAVATAGRRLKLPTTRDEPRNAKP